MPKLNTSAAQAVCNRRQADAYRRLPLVLPVNLPLDRQVGQSTSSGGEAVDGELHTELQRLFDRPTQTRAGQSVPARQEVSNPHASHSGSLLPHNSRRMHVLSCGTPTSTVDA